MEKQLHLLETEEIAKEKHPHKGTPRIKSPVRDQIEFNIGSLDELIPPDHMVRFVWDYVCKLDMDSILTTIHSVQGNAGRPATDPRILLSIWLFATLEGIVSSRVIEEFCNEHIAYQWLCGGVYINHHTLSDFAGKYGSQFEEFLIQSVGILAKENVIDFDEISQDGLRVRASAGTGSFRRQKSLEELCENAEKYLKNLRTEFQKNPSSSRNKKEASRIKAAEERERKTKQAIEELKKLKEQKLKRGKKGAQEMAKYLEEARASITDPECRNIKMPDGGFRPAYNVQFATTKKGLCIVGVDVTNQSNDAGLIKGMIDYVREKYHKLSNKWLVDGGYYDLDEINTISKEYPNCKIYMPERNQDVEKELSIFKEDRIGIRDWRDRMRTEEGKNIYKNRMGTAEFSNAQSRNKGLRQFLVKGLEKAKFVAHRFALVHNMQRYFRLRARMA